MFFRLFISFIFFFTFSSASYSSTEILLKESRQSKEKSISVQIFPEGYIWVNSNNDSTIYDYNKKRIYRLNSKSNTSLYSVIAFRLSEAQNRLYLGSILSKANVPPLINQPSIIDHTFSIKSHTPLTYTVSNTTENGIVSFISSANILSSFSEKTIPAEPANLKGFIMFLRYEYGIHPDILDRITSQKGIPKKLIIYDYNLNDKDKVTLELSSIRDINSKKLKKALKRQDKISLGDKSDLGLQIDSLKPNQKKVSQYVDNLLKSADSLYKKEHYIESVLAYLEFSILTGKNLPEGFLNKKESFMEKDSVKQLFASINPGKEEYMLGAIQKLIHYQQTAQKHQAVLYLFEANLRLSEGNPRLAKKLYLKSLKLSPYLVGAYHDLGNLFSKEYDMQSAWACWDIARKVMPNHNILKEISKNEVFYEKTFPEYFSF